MTNLTRWDPFRGSISLREAMDRLFEESFVHPFGRWPLLEGEARPLALDLSETEEDLVVEASLPGFDSKDVDISIVGNTLTIKGEKKQENEKEEKGKYHLRERRYGAFQRTITLPTDVDADAAEAIFENGELKLTLPKVEAARPKRIELKAK
jgi:HSP20 family protein